MNRREIISELGQHDEERHDAGPGRHARSVDLHERVAGLARQLDAHLTTVQSHAELARERVELARAEARADLERTRDMLVELIEQVRRDAGQRPAHHVAGTAPGASIEARAEQIERLEHHVDALAETVQACFAQQRELADTMAAFLDTMLAERRGEPITGLSLG